MAVLLRGDAAKRLSDEILPSGPCEGLDGSRVRAISGDLGREGLDVGDGIDVVIHCAASVSFEQALDEALELNAKGPARLLETVRDAGSDPYFIHVSTAYAAGMRTGLVLEKPSGTAPTEPWLDLNAELDAAKAWRRGHRGRVAPPGPPAPLRRRGAPRDRPRRRPGGRHARRDPALRVGPRPAHRARSRTARALGWSDTYGLAKAIGERTLISANPRQLDDRPPGDRRVRAAHAVPGLDGVAEGRRPDHARLRRRHHPGRFGANRSIRIDIIPVDFVANAPFAAGAPASRTCACSTSARACATRSRSATSPR